jgi:hypothetical protein
VANVAAAGLGLAAGTDVSFGLMAYYLAPPIDYSVPGVAITAVGMYLFTGRSRNWRFGGIFRTKSFHR